MDNKKRWNKAAVASFVVVIAILGTADILNSVKYPIVADRLFETSAAVASSAGIVLAAFSLVSMWRRPGQKGMMPAICGLIFNVLILEPILETPTHCECEHCASNLKMISNSLYQYTQDNNGLLPPPDSWNKAATVKYGYILSCAESLSSKPAYAINRELIGIDFTNMENPRDIIMIFECKPGENRVGRVDIAEFRHAGGCNACFADGHVKWLTKERFRKYMSMPITFKKPTSFRVPSD